MIRRRIALTYWVIALGLFTPCAAHAYIDPATTTYIIQIMTALVVTLGISLSIFLYKFNMLSAKIKFGFYGLFYRLSHRGAGNGGEKPEERGNTHTQSDDAAPDGRYSAADYYIPGSPEPPTEEELEALGEPTDMERMPEKDGKQGLPGNLGYFGRMRLALPVSLALSLTFIFIGCIDLIIHNRTDIMFSLSGVIPVLALASAACFAVMLFVIPLFKGRIYPVILSIAATVLIAGYLQGTVFNRGLGELDGGAIEWGLYRSEMAGSVALWIAVFVIVLLLIIYVKPSARWLLVFAPILLIVIQGVGLISLVGGKAGDDRGTISVYWEESPERLTFQGVFELAAERNVIVIILDRFDQRLVDEVVSEDPGFFDGLDGFTMFEDNITSSAKTFPAITEMLTGQRFRWDRSDSDFFKEAWSHPTFLDALVEKGVDVRLYTFFGFVYDDIEQLRGVASNIGEVKEVINPRIALVKLLKLSAFRYAPMPLKQKFWMAPDEFQHAVVFTGETMPYNSNDFAFYDALLEDRLSYSESRLAFSFYHLNGPHPPLNMDENVNFVEESTLMKQAMGSMEIVYEYLRQLKELGLYESSTILIMADHGIPEAGVDGDNRLTSPVHALLLVKPYGVSGTPLEYNYAPVNPDELPGTVMEGFFGDTEGFGPGYLDVPEGAGRAREYLQKQHLYEVFGDGRDFVNWEYLKTFEDRWGSKAG